MKRRVYVNRYAKNFNLLTKEENAHLKSMCVCVIGCGGLGGYIIEMLARLGVGRITAVDGDVFDETNLNRQILSEESLIGHLKADVAKARILRVNSEIFVEAKAVYLNSENAEMILAGHDVVVDALDNVPARRLIQSACEVLNIPFVHGAIAGWYGQVSTIMPGDRTLDLLYPESLVKGIETELGNPSFTPALVASIQVSEVLKLLIGRGDVLSRKLLTLNLLDHEYEVLEF